ncbi:MAG: signal peptidase II [Lachnospiraceae bacterium]
MGMVLFVGISCALLITDLFIKKYVEENVESTKERALLDGKVLIRKVYNKGLMLSMLEKYPKVVKAASGGAGILLAVYDLFLLTRKGHFIKKTGISFMVGGAFSNLYDRLVRGYVVDYVGFQTKWKKLTDVTFNLGDFFIFAGGILVVITALFRKKK